MAKSINGFSKLPKTEKIDWLVENFCEGSPEAEKVLKQYWNADAKLQQLHDEFIENTISNFYLPLGLAPNFLINEEYLTLPMVIEESSVVAAASKAAKFWSERGGFKARVISTEKIGQVHFKYSGDRIELEKTIEQLKPKMLEAAKPITQNMEKRGGGILSIDLVDKTKQLKEYFQLFVTFDTRDSMGANFINSCLEKFAEILETNLPKEQLTVIMSILSNYVPECLVYAEVSCKVDDLGGDSHLSGEEFAEKFVQAVNIAEVEPYRAVTHNKGVMNGIDAVVLATGNDFRAVEAGVHAFASKDGRYTSLTHAEIKNGIFRFWIEIPLALGTVGGLTSLHPLVKLALDILQRPNALELMKIAAVAGLAQNFAALRSLITTGIQQGHMKMHLMNILNQHQATKEEKKKMVDFFTHHTITHSSVIEQLEKLRANEL
ncbi:MAG: hydroxymethylglutaryl-CoA reductase, degradative [Christiangramia sp.]|nr:hydroxymethylglutaryl-CoA reductase, degradative [Christiangramia sp.]